MANMDIVSLEKENKIAFMTCIEVVLMRRGAQYNLAMAKLRAYYESYTFECLDNLEYLKDVLKQVYMQEYPAVIQEIKLETEKLVDMDSFKDEFFKKMKD